MRAGETPRRVESITTMNRERLIEWVETHTDEMIADFQRLLRAESIRSEPDPHAPFGRGVRDALDIVLELGERFNMRPRDFDGYACDLEIGTGNEMVASLSHIDVVPAGTGWTKPPFGALIENGYIYARGATDNKGATIASLYAVRHSKSWTSH